MPRPRSSALRAMSLAFVVGMTSVADARADEPTDEASEAAGLPLARQRFQRGLALYDQKRFTEAAREFVASIELYASPNSHLYLARCYRQLGQAVDAMVHYERAVALAADRAAADPRYRDTGSAARDELAIVRAQVGRLRVTVTDAPLGTRVFIGRRELPAAAWGLEVPVDAGEVRVRASAPGHVALDRSLAVAPGQVAELSLRLLPMAAPSEPPVVMAPPVEPATDSSPRRWWAISGLAVGVAGAASFATFALLAEGQHETLVDRCGALPCPQGEADAIERGRTYQTLANVSLGVAAVGAAAALASWAWPAQRPGDAARAALRIGPTGIGGRF